MPNTNLSPREITARLDESIIGQNEAKRKVAIAMRNRYRRMLLDDELKEEVIPKNILMIGPTGVGKTEIARRIAKITGSPYTKVEATKYTEVGYVGRDVESMVRDLVDSAVRMAEDQKKNEVAEDAENLANEQLTGLLAPGHKKKTPESNNKFQMLMNQQNQDHELEEVDDSISLKRRDIQSPLLDGQQEKEKVRIGVAESSNSHGIMMPGLDITGMGD